MSDVSMLNAARWVPLLEAARTQDRLLVEAEMTNKAWRIAFAQGKTIVGTGAFTWRINEDDKVMYYPPKAHWWSRKPEPYVRYMSATIHGAWNLEELNP